MFHYPHNAQMKQFSKQLQNYFQTKAVQSFAAGGAAKRLSTTVVDPMLLISNTNHKRALDSCLPFARRYDFWKRAMPMVKVPKETVAVRLTALRGGEIGIFPLVPFRICKM